MNVGGMKFGKWENSEKTQKILTLDTTLPALRFELGTAVLTNNCAARMTMKLI